MLLADVVAEDARERPEPARMWTVELAVAADVRERPAQQRRDVVLVHARADNALALIRTPRLGDQRHQRRGRIGAAQRGDLPDRLARVRRVWRKRPQNEIVGRGDLLQDEVGLGAIGEVAIRVEHRQRRLPHRPRVDIGGNDNAFAPRRVELRDKLVALSPEPAHRELHVGHLHRHVCDAADRDQLVERRPELAVLAADVADVAAARRAGHLRKLEHLARSREDAGVVLEAGRQTNGAGSHLLAQQPLHAIDFAVRRDPLEVVAHHAASERAVSGIGGDVDRRRLRIEPCEERGERQLRLAVLADHDGRDALADRRKRVPAIEDAAVVMAVRVDEAWGKREPARVDHAVRGSGVPAADRLDRPVHDPHVRAARRRSRAIENHHVGDDHGLREGGRRPEGKYRARGDQCPDVHDRNDTACCLRGPFRCRRDRVSVPACLITCLSATASLLRPRPRA